VVTTYLRVVALVVELGEMRLMRFRLWSNIKVRVEAIRLTKKFFYSLIITRDDISQPIGVGFHP